MHTNHSEQFLSLSLFKFSRFGEGQEEDKSDVDCWNETSQNDVVALRSSCERLGFELLR